MSLHDALNNLTPEELAQFGDDLARELHAQTQRAGAKADRTKLDDLLSDGAIEAAAGQLLWDIGYPLMGVREQRIRDAARAMIIAAWNYEPERERD